MEKNKLEIKHLAPYLPYGLKICYRILDLEYGNPNTDNPDDRMKNCIMIMDGARLDRCLLPESDRWYHKDCLFKPVLRPLSDLFLPVKISDLELIPVNTLKNLYGWDYLWYDVFGNKKDFNVNEVKWASLVKLFEWHFDVFGLIGRGLAIDINTINK
jgi:hypothetical protein